MITRWLEENDGQALILVALALVVLLGAGALAVDAGHLYQTRRQMQNAADAGALAGARAVCFGGDPAQEARDYIVANGGREPEPGEIDVGTTTVSVVAVTTTNTFVASVIGHPTAPVSATAAAVCGSATSACGFWPLAYHEDDWAELECDQLFYVWNDNQAQDVDCTDECDCNIFISTIEGKQGVPDIVVNDWITIADTSIIATDERGWVLLPDPAPEDDPYNCGGNCGSQTKCYVEHDYLGEVTTEGAVCLPGNPGVIDKAEELANPRSGDQVNILIWNNATVDECGGETLGTCPGDPYRIVGMGTIEIVGATTIDIPQQPDPDDPGGKVKYCMQNVKVILARVVCDAATSCGGGSETPAGDKDLRGVSLIR